MEHLPGDSLRERMEAGGIRSVEAREITRQLATAVAAASAAGIGSLVLRPNQIVFGEDGRAKNTALVLDDPPGSAPTAREEVYALGRILYEMLTGASPPLRRSGVPSPEQVKPDISPELSAITMRALSPDARKRFGSASELAQALAGDTPNVSRTARAPSRLGAANEAGSGRSLAHSLMNVLLAVVALVLILGGGAILWRGMTSLSAEVSEGFSFASTPSNEEAVATGEAEPAFVTATPGTEASATPAENVIVVTTVEPTPSATQSPAVSPSPSPAASPTVDSDKPEPPPIGQDDELHAAPVGAPSIFVATIGTLPPEVDYDLYLYDASGQIVERSTEPGNAAERIEVELPTGEYTLRVHFYNGPPNIPYDLQWQWAPAGGGE
jgi:hypothetical protein